MPTRHASVSATVGERRMSEQQEQPSRFQGAKLDDFCGTLYELCKDQNGCRFLQKKLEEQGTGAQNLLTIFNEIHTHFMELMTGKKKEMNGLFTCLIDNALFS